ncbi:MAG: protein kinase [Deltaproteobacteria bacterium]|nr:protein kinase [Deltaproteobacteria bacterium]
MEARSLGKYELIEEVGQGGMSVVYRGRDTVLGREVAIKVMHPFMAQKSDAKQRFYREAMAVAKLSHPNILEIYDYSGETAEQAYIVMEFIRGETLSSFASRVNLTLPELGFLVIRALALALAHAHEQGIIHRDLKPENVMIRRDGQLKLMDFGIAQMIDADTLTTTGALLGSPAHMSPELIEGEICDIRSDIFSTGTILYWLITRRLPFTAPTAPALFKRIVDGNFDDPRMHNPLVTQGMLRILHKLMKKRRDERYPNARAFIADIDQELRLSGIDSPETALSDMMKNPAAYQAHMTSEIAKRLRTAGDDAYKKNDLPGALAAYDRLLNLDPNDGLLREKVLAIGKKQRRMKRLKRMVKSLELGAAFCVSLGGVALAGWQYLSDPLSEPPIVEEAAPQPKFVSTVMRPQESAEEPKKSEAAVAAAAAAKEAAQKVVPREVELRLQRFCSIYIDGELVRKDVQGPIQQTLDSGEHELRAENPFMEPVTRKIAIPPEGPIEPVIVNFDRFRPARLRVLAPQGAQVIVDGEARGPASASEQAPFLVPMQSGDRKIEVKVVVPGQPDIKPKQRVVQAGRPAEVDFRID